MAYKSDIEIAREAKKQPIQAIGDTLGIPSGHLLPYGHDKAKVGQPDRQEGGDLHPRSLARPLNFGMKGGAAGGGYAQVVPMEDMNLHFTGDFHAITSAHNLLSAMIDNHIYWGNELRDRRAPRRLAPGGRHERPGAAPDHRLSLGGVANGFPREGRFDITVASEVMAILCLATDLTTCRSGWATSSWPIAATGSPVYARDIKADGAMTVLLKDAMQPNLVQTLENNPAFVHGGPFANIAHGCNSVTRRRRR